MAKPFDEIGAETLRRMNRLDAYNKWIVEKIQPWVGDVVLEVGAGIGNISRFFLGRRELILADIDESYLEILRKKFASCPNVVYVRYNLEKSGSHLAGRGIDTVIALNVLEHIDNDQHALNEISSILVPGGCVVLQVPSHKLFYGSLDKNLGHYRRYSSGEIREKFKIAGLEPEFICHMNMFGALGWFVNSCILKRKILPRGQLGTFNVLTPLFIAFERLIPPPFGLSVIAVGRKPL